MNKEAKEEESKHVKREVEGERGRVEIQRICVERLSGEVLCPVSEVKSVGDSLGFSVCVCACCASVCACGGG